MKFVKILVKAFICFYVLLHSCVSLATVQWHMINVNNNTQGDAHLLEDNGFFTLVDAGQRAESSYLLNYLGKFNFEFSSGYKRIDIFFLSHPHHDHVGGYMDLIENGISCNKFYHNPPPEGVGDFAYNKADYDLFLDHVRSTGCEVIDVKKSLRISTGLNTKMKVLHAQSGHRFEDGQSISVNDYSVVMRWQFYGRRALFTGDLNRPLGLILSEDKRMEADFLKVPHHGVSGIAPDSFFDTVDPLVLLSPMPAFLWMIDRSEQLREWLERNPNTSFCSNGFSGNVKLLFTETGYSIGAEKNESSCLLGAHNWEERIFKKDPDELAFMQAITLLLGD